MMSEKVDERVVFSLQEVTQSIQRTLNDRYQSSFWVRAEMNKLNHYIHSGHCYPDLLEKRNGKMVAQMRALLWKDDYDRINSAFLNILKEPLKDGINILFCARVSFDTVYGLSLRILDIDPSWSLGELQREKQAAIEKLRKEGLLTRNRELPFPLLPQRVAVISVETSKGYADFLTITGQNPWGYAFFHMLFPSVLQGDKVSESIIRQLGIIEKVSHHFDVVAIIRGGGGDVGLSGYNHYDLARRIALFPLPVITGIGHVTNETVAEMVAFRNCITPTELADFLIQQFHNFSVPVRQASESLKEAAHRLISESKRSINLLSSGFLKMITSAIDRAQKDLHSCATRVVTHTLFYIRSAREQTFRSIDQIERNALSRLRKEWNVLLVVRETFAMNLNVLFRQKSTEMDHLEKQITLLDPTNILSRGYSITLKNGNAMKSSSEALPGDHIRTQLYEGFIESTITVTDLIQNNTTSHE